VTASLPLEPGQNGATGCLYGDIYAVVGRIPYGTVATYGQVAVLAGHPGCARQVGYALAGLPDKLELPWHRVINASGRVSPRRHSGWHEYQQELLEREGIRFEGGRTSLGHYGWRPSGEDA
jgi:methylated-DNA-protein-cysteine methyltransferase related protein